VAGRELTSKREKSRHVAGYEGVEVEEGSRDIGRRLRAGECARTRVASTDYMALYPRRWHSS
jgi:hypothetical protein